MDLKISLVFIISVLIWDQVQTTKTFKLNVHENGVDFVEDLRFEGNLQIIEVPAHHDRLATKYVKDISKKLQLQVMWVPKECLISKIFYPVESEVQIEALEAQELIPVDYENATHVDIIQIEGPEMDHSEIPHSLRSYCPDNFTAKAIHLVEERSKVDENSEGFLIQDPEIDSDVLNNTPPPHVTDTLHFLSRKKRDVCRDADGNIEPDCEMIHSYCPDRSAGCHAQHVYYRCSQTTRSYSCEYVLTCSRTSLNGVSCLKHMTARGRKCHMCCRYLDCGKDLPRCSSVGTPTCFEQQRHYVGYPLGSGSRQYWENSASDCQRRCQNKSRCAHFNFIKEDGEDEGECKMQTQKGTFENKPTCVGCETGPRVCP